MSEYQYIADNEQVEVTRNENTENYTIIVGNPLNGNVAFETETSWLKINGVGFSANAASFSEHNTKIGITENGNIELDI
jgi:hypothetical protein